jgi:hypothetical protein
MFIIVKKMSQFFSGFAQVSQVQFKSNNQCLTKDCTKLKFTEPRTGFQHDFCGRLHAELSLKAQGKTLSKPKGYCHNCHLNGCEKTVYFNEINQRVHDFCSKKHALLAISRGEVRKSNLKANAKCSFSGCTKPCYIDAFSGQLYDFCGRTHAIESRSVRTKVKEECVICLNSPAEFQFLPCLHVCACKKCANSLTVGSSSPLCPLCRTPIQSLKNVMQVVHWAAA